MNQLELVQDRIVDGIQPKELDKYLKSMNIESPSRTLRRQQRALDKTIRGWVQTGRCISRRQAGKRFAIQDRYWITRLNILRRLKYNNSR